MKNSQGIVAGSYDPASLLEKEGIMDWIEKLQSGDFLAIPGEMTWDNGGRRIAQLIDGYDLARFSQFKRDGSGEVDGLELASFVNHNVRILLEKGEDVTAIDLWTSMFFEARREHFMMMPSGSSPQHDCALDVMSVKLPQALKAASDVDLERLRKAIADYSIRLGRSGL